MITLPPWSRPRDRRPRPAPRPCIRLGCVLAALVAAASAQPSAGTEAAPHRIRVGFSNRTMGDRNRNDVTAALKVWIQTIATEREVAADPTPRILESVQEMCEAMRRGEVDVITAASNDFLAVEKAVPVSHLYVCVLSGRIDEEYVLVVRQDGGMQGLADLRGRRLLVADTTRTSLALPWLDLELMKAKLPLADRHFHEVAKTSKVNQAIFPVFFRQADACLVTRASFEVAGELNPQLPKTLRVLATSPALIPAVGTYRADLPHDGIKRYLDEMLHLDRTTAGKHILELFECSSMKELTPEEFTPTRSFLAEHARMKAATEATPDPP